MPKCETCYHYDVCKNYLKELNYTIGVDIRATKCPFFKDKSLLFETPVKVGQSIWSAEPFTDGVAREGWITTIMADHNGFSGFWVSFGEIPMSAEFMDIEIGQTVFLTQKEAENHKKEV